MSYVSPQDERDEVRLNCGNTGESNLPEAAIDEALVMADEETTERTGLSPSDPRRPAMRRKMKILLASAYLMIRFSDLADVRSSILKEVNGMEQDMKVLETTDLDDESIISEGDPEYNPDVIDFWGGSGGGTRSSVAIGASGMRRRGKFTVEDWKDYTLVRLGS